MRGSPHQPASPPHHGGLFQASPPHHGGLLQAPARIMEVYSKHASRLVGKNDRANPNVSRAIWPCTRQNESLYSPMKIVQKRTPFMLGCCNKTHHRGSVRSFPGTINVRTNRLKRPPNPTKSSSIALHNISNNIKTCFAFLCSIYYFLEFSLMPLYFSRPGQCYGIQKPPSQMLQNHKLSIP